jgi:hypothetical protein
LREIDNLWVEHSEERYGFSVQKEKFQTTGNTPGGQYNDEAYIRFLQEVGWLRIVNNEIDWLFYNELEWLEGVEGEELTSPSGHLPEVGRVRGIENHDYSFLEIAV